MLLSQVKFSLILATLGHTFAAPCNSKSHEGPDKCGNALKEVTINNIIIIPDLNVASGQMCPIRSDVPKWLSDAFPCLTASPNAGMQSKNNLKSYFPNPSEDSFQNIHKSRLKDQPTSAGCGKATLICKILSAILTQKTELLECKDDADIWDSDSKESSNENIQELSNHKTRMVVNKELLPESVEGSSGENMPRQHSIQEKAVTKYDTQVLNNVKESIENHSEESCDETSNESEQIPEKKTSLREKDGNGNGMYESHKIVSEIESQSKVACEDIEARESAMEFREDCSVEDDTLETDTLETGNKESINDNISQVWDKQHKSDSFIGNSNGAGGNSVEIEEGELHTLKTLAKSLYFFTPIMSAIFSQIESSHSMDSKTEAQEGDLADDLIMSSVLLPVHSEIGHKREDDISSNKHSNVGTNHFGSLTSVISSVLSSSDSKIDYSEEDKNSNRGGSNYLDALTSIVSTVLSPSNSEINNNEDDANPTSDNTSANYLNTLTSVVSSVLSTSDQEDDDEDDSKNKANDNLTNSMEVTNSSIKFLSVSGLVGVISKFNIVAMLTFKYVLQLVVKLYHYFFQPLYVFRIHEWFFGPLIHIVPGLLSNVLNTNNWNSLSFLTGQGGIIENCRICNFFHKLVLEINKTKDYVRALKSIAHQCSSKSAGKMHKSEKIIAKKSSTNLEDSVITDDGSDMQRQASFISFLTL